RHRVVRRHHFYTIANGDLSDARAIAYLVSLRNDQVRFARQAFVILLALDAPSSLTGVDGGHALGNAVLVATADFQGDEVTNVGTGTHRTSRFRLGHGSPYLCHAQQ